MAKLKTFDPDRIRQIRRRASLTQFEYWSRFGVTQSGGSRYETMRAIPMPTAMLIWLHESGRITDQDLVAARKAVKPRSGTA
jgi:transcriptional regulator with XRE-family HTH domain